MIYGELGKVPTRHRSCCKMYTILISCAKATYCTVLRDGIASRYYLCMRKGHEKWATHVKPLLGKCDNSNVWLFRGIGDGKLFLRDFKECLRRKIHWGLVFPPFTKFTFWNVSLLSKCYWEKSIWTLLKWISTGLHSHDSDLGCFRLMHTDFVTHSQR